MRVEAAGARVGRGEGREGGGGRRKKKRRKRRKRKRLRNKERNRRKPPGKRGTRQEAIWIDSRVT